MADRSQYGYVSIELRFMKKIEGAVRLNIKADRSQYGYVSIEIIFLKKLMKALYDSTSRLTAANMVMLVESRCFAIRGTCQSKYG